MDKLKTERLAKACQRISDSFCAAIKDIGGFVNGGLITMTEIAEAENALAAVSNYDVVFVLRPVTKELSELTVYRYVDYLDQAREMILEGKDIPYVLFFFDMILYDLKHGRK